MMLQNEAQNNPSVVSSLFKAANGFRFKETTVTTIRRDGEIIQEKTEVHDRYFPPDLAAARLLFEVGGKLPNKEGGNP